MYLYEGTESAEAITYTRGAILTLAAFSKMSASYVNVP